MQKRLVTIVNERGIHAAAATKLGQLAKKFASSITFIKDGMKIDANNIMGIFLLEGCRGCRFWVITEGPDEREAMNAIIDLVRNRFYEDY